jgi:hypothetical protein
MFPARAINNQQQEKARKKNGTRRIKTVFAIKSNLMNIYNFYLKLL